MATFTIDVGLPDIVTSSGDPFQELYEVMIVDFTEEVSEDITDALRAASPVKTGYLKSQWDVFHDYLVSQIVNDTPYLPYVHRKANKSALVIDDFREVVSRRYRDIVATKWEEVSDRYLRRFEWLAAQ